MGDWQTQTQHLQPLTLTMLQANSADETNWIYIDKTNWRYIYIFFFWKIGSDTKWSVKSYFLGEIRKIFQNVVCWNIYPACKVLTFSMVKWNSCNWQLTFFFYCFLKIKLKYSLTFHANCCHTIKFGLTFHANCLCWRQFAWKCQVEFSWKRNH